MSLAGSGGAVPPLHVAVAAAAAASASLGPAAGSPGASSRPEGRSKAAEDRPARRLGEEEGRVIVTDVTDGSPASDGSPVMKSWPEGPGARPTPADAPTLVLEDQVVEEVAPLDARAPETADGGVAGAERRATAPVTAEATASTARPAEGQGGAGASTPSKDASVDAAATSAAAGSAETPAPASAAPEAGKAASSPAPSLELVKAAPAPAPAPGPVTTMAIVPTPPQGEGSASSSGLMSEREAEAEWRRLNASFEISPPATSGGARVDTVRDGMKALRDAMIESSRAQLARLHSVDTLVAVSLLAFLSVCFLFFFGFPPVVAPELWVDCAAIGSEFLFFLFFPFPRASGRVFLQPGWRTPTVAESFLHSLSGV